MWPSQRWWPCPHRFDACARGRPGRQPLACVGETLRAALNDLAVVAPDWLRQQITADWFERYGKRFEASRLPQGEAKRYAYAEQIGADGLQLLSAIYHATTPHWVRESACG